MTHGPVRGPGVGVRFCTQMKLKSFQNKCPDESLEAFQNHIAAELAFKL